MAIFQIIVGSIVAKAPSSSMAPAAFADLSLAVELFQKSADISERERTGLVSLYNIVFFYFRKS